MMAGNPNWWSMISPSSIFPSQYVIGSSNTLPQLSSLTSFLDQQSLEPPQSWSQLLLGGLSGEDQDSFGSSSHFTPKRLENWEDHHQQVLIPQYPRVPVISCNIIKQEVSSQNNSSLCGGDDGGHEEFQASYNTRPSWSPVQINMPVSSPRYCVTSLSSNNILGFSYDQKNQPADHSSECNSPPVGGICKKARVQRSSSQPPLKVRKEKLGDRITALHQIVFPFGKTDTASVLLEAIGYIRFLESQIEALSTPYLGNASKNLRNSPHTVQGERNCMFPEDPGQLLNDKCSSLKRKGAPNQDSHEEYKAKDLRSKGLCLVPVSCIQNVGADINIGADYWAPAYGSGF